MRFISKAPPVLRKWLTPGHGKYSVPRSLAVIASFALVGLTLVAASPSEGLYHWTQPLTHAVFERPATPDDWQSYTWLSNRLVLSDVDFGVTAMLKAQKELNQEGRVSLSLRGRDLTGAILDRTDLRSADFTSATLRGASLNDARLNGAQFGCGRKDVEWDRDFEVALQTQISKCVDLQFAQLDGANLEHAVLTGAHLQGASLKRAILRQANADYSFLQGVTATSVEAQGGSFVGAELQGALFTNAHLEGAIFERADMRWGAFDEAHFETAGFQGVDARAASFGLASFQGAVISQSDFRGAIFNSAELQGTIIYQTQLKGAYFDDAYVYRLTCVPPVPFYRCENLKFDFGWTVHRTIHTVKALRRPVGDKPIAPDEGAAYTEFANGIVSRETASNCTGSAGFIGSVGAHKRG